MNEHGSLRAESAGVFSGLVVIDTSQDIAGSMVGMMLADHGAEVVKVEPPHGDPQRATSAWRVRNRGKKSIVIDLRSEAGATEFNALAQRADVIIDGAPSVLGSMPSWSYTEAARENPGLILCSISGYGDVPVHDGRPVSDPLVAARCGVQWEKRGWPGGSIERVNGIEGFLMDYELDPHQLEGPPRDGPLYSAIPWTSLATFQLALVGVSAAIYAREITGLGQEVSTSLLQGALVNGAFAWQRVTTPDRPGYRMWMTDPRVPHGFYPTKDGRWVHNWAPQPSFAFAIGPAGVTESRDAVAAKNDAMRIGMDPENMLVLQEFQEPMTEIYQTRDADEWESLAGPAGLSVVKVRSPEEALLTPSFLEDGCVVELPDDEVGTIRCVGRTYQLHEAPASIIKPAPRLDADADSVRADLLRRPSRSASAPEPDGDLTERFARGPLTGITVLDLGLAVAGPYGGQILADLGANVIKINRQLDQAWFECYMAAMCNRGKRSISLDLKSLAGHEVFEEMVRRADVVHLNMRMDAVVSLGIDYESLRKINPRLVYCHTRGYENGPRINWLGHDQSGSAISGVTWTEGGLDDEGKPIWPNISLGDTGNGLMSAAAVIQALYDRERTGRGQFVDTSIAYVHLLNSSAAWVTPDGRVAGDRPKLDRMQFGTGPLTRLYRTRAGWICLDVSSEQQWISLCAAIGRTHLSSDPRFATAQDRRESHAELVGILEPIFEARSADEWVELLDAGGVPCEVSAERFSIELFDDAEMIKRGLVVTHDHPLFGTLEMAGHGVSFSRTPATIELGPCVPGQHTREVLRELELGDDQIGRLLESGAASEFVR